MRNVLSAVLMWWLSPPGPQTLLDAEGKRLSARRLKSYLMLALITLFLCWNALVFYCIWLFVALLHGAFHYRYALADEPERPSTYGQAAELLLVIDIFNHVALAGFSSIGWWALVPVGLTWYFFGRLVGRLAAAKAWEGVADLVGRLYPSESTDDQAEIARGIIRERIALLSE